MHQIADFCSIVEFFDLALLLYQTLSDHRLDELLGSMTASVDVHWSDLAHCCSRDACELGQLVLIVIPCRREEMHRTSGSYSRSYRFLEFCKRSGRSAADERTFGCDGRLRTHPDNIINIYIVTIETLEPAVNVKHSSKAWFIYTPIIEEVAVLTELIVIAAIVGRSIHIAKEDGDTASVSGSHTLDESTTSLYIYIRIKHIILYLYSTYYIIALYLAYLRLKSFSGRAL
jgi:hypothetical protein